MKASATLKNEERRPPRKAAATQAIVTGTSEKQISRCARDDNEFEHEGIEKSLGWQIWNGEEEDGDE
jgi:hypothetical protein